MTARRKLSCSTAFLLGITSTIAERPLRVMNNALNEDCGNELLMKKNGASEGIRTLDVHLGKVVLYQLSYARFLRSADEK